jgi:hypothetical protein
VGVRGLPYEYGRKGARMTREERKKALETLKNEWGDIDMEQFEQAKELIIKLGHIIVEAFKPILEKFQDFFDTLEPYQKFEFAHPRKKPRGSIRRARRARKEQE